MPSSLSMDRIESATRAPTAVKLGFVTSQDPGDVTGWSGINTFMSRALAGAGADVTPLFGYTRSRPIGALAKKAWAHLVLRRYYEVGRNPAVLRNYARQVERRASESGVQALFSTGTHLTADCDLKCPLFFWTDATVPALFAIYPGYERFWSVGYDEALASERRAVSHAAAMFFSSQWAADSAVRDLGADPKRVHVVPFGANFENEPDGAEALSAAACRAREKIVLLFAGVDWKRKGGEKALAIARALAESGAPVELHLLGVDSDVRLDAVEFAHTNLMVTWHGRISKGSEQGRRHIEALFERAHFLLLPTLADCTPMVFAEANAYAMPVVTHRTGGIPTMIRDERNGRMFALESTAQEQAAWIAEIWRDGERYRALAASSRDEYDARLNWRSSAAQVMAVVREVLKKEDV
jgi:glycosyltransferase involved in cell wall biosynthesis